MYFDAVVVEVETFLLLFRLALAILLVVPPPTFWTFHHFDRPLPGVIYDSLFTLQDLDMTFFMPYFEIAFDNTAICTLYLYQTRE